MTDEINNPKHYTSHPSKVQCIELVRYIQDIRISSAIQYIWRCDIKGHKQVDIEKAIWYLTDFIENKYEFASREQRLAIIPIRKLTAFTCYEPDPQKSSIISLLVFAYVDNDAQQVANCIELIKEWRNEEKEKMQGVPKGL